MTTLPPDRLKPLDLYSMLVPMGEALLQKPGLRRALATVALAPVTSLLVSQMLAAGIGAAGLGRRLPVGVHTYVPAVNLVDVRWLELGSLICALLGLGLAAFTGNRSGGKKPTGWLLAALYMVGILVLAQLALYAAQALFVAELQGLPDTAQAALLALALQGILTLAATLSVGSMGMLIPILGGAQAPRLKIPAATSWPLRVAAPANRSFIELDAPRRGPPILLLSK